MTQDHGARHPRRLTTRLFLLTLPVVALVVLLTQAGVGYLHYTEQLRDLEARQTLTAELTAEAIAQPMWRLDRTIYESQARAVTRDDAFRHIRIRDEGGDTLFEQGPGLAGEPGSTIRVPVTDPGRGVELGQLELTYTTVALREGLQQQLLIGVTAFAALLIGMFVVFYAGVQRLVLAPLRRLLTAMGEVRRKQWTTLPVERNDELGETYRAFNAMVEGLRSGDEAQRLLVELERANHRIWESIHYARTIQVGMLPAPEALDGLVAEVAVDWQPLDVVGGDVYWWDRRGDRAVIFLADCTGHGVPGAFMTLVVANALTRLLETTPWDSPARLLTALDQRVRERLARDQNDPLRDDGLDAALCVIDRGAGTIRFAGASLHLLYGDAEGLRLVRGERCSLGYHHPVHPVTVMDHDFRLRSGYRYYLMTDGVTDHVGGQPPRLFGRRRVVEALERTGDQAIASQLAALRAELDDYRGDQPRRDDFAIVGFQPLPPGAGDGSPPGRTEPGDRSGH